MHRSGGGEGTSVNPIVVLLVLHLTGSIQGRNNGPSVPDTPCHIQRDCVAMGWMEPLPECDNLTCTCPSGTCPIYTTASGSFEYQYFCGPCGMLGSKCNNSTDCVVDWRCRNNFCECDQGAVYQGVCMYYEAVHTSVSTVAIVLILMFIVAIQQVISSRKTLRRLFCRSSSESEDEVSRVVASNPQSNDKTAAFTIANADFMVTDANPESTWALELSLRFNEPGASTWSSTTSSFPPPDPRFIRPRPFAQPGPFGSSFPSASLRSIYSSFTSSSRPSSLALSDEVSLPTLESLRMDRDVNDFQSTRV